MDLFSNVSNQNAFSLTKASSNDDLKRYFAAILEISRSGNEFPIDLDEVWMLAYGQKSDAVAALKASFIQNVDYQVLRQNPQNPNGGRPANVYKLSVSCMEFFVARKIRPVFEVYRQVFHGMANTYQVPQSFSEALMLAAKQQQTIEQQQKQIEVKDEKIQLLTDEVKTAAPKVNYFDTTLQSVNTYTSTQMSKELGLREAEQLHKILKGKGIMFKQSGQWLLTAKYSEKGYTKPRTHQFTRNDGTIGTNTTTVWTEKGRAFLHNILDAA